jgi:predicted MFS family arabinose efflux permease
MSPPPVTTVRADLHRILGVQALRALLYGFGSVVLGSTLAAGGLSDERVGLLFATMLVGTALSSIVVGIVGDRVGRRGLYRLLLVVMGMSGAIYALTDSFAILLLVALTGTLSTDPNESGPITSLEQAMMGSARADERARVFGRYNAVAFLAGAVGALMGGGPGLFRRWFPELPPDQRWLLLFPLLALGCLVLARRLSSGVEAGRTPGRRPLQRSRSTVARLAALFGLDSFAGGFIVSTFLVFWFNRRFGASPEVMGAVMFAGGLIQAGSSVLSGWLGTRIGLLNTMVFTHLPSNVLLALVPFMPSLALAIPMLLLRFTLSQMDVPARQAYVVAMVDPDERTAAAAFTNTARYVARPFGAAGAGALMGLGIGAPFVVAGSLKIVYDLALYTMFRKVPLPEEPTAEETSPRLPA